MTSWYHGDDQDDLDDAILDFSGLRCPRCGCNDIEIWRLPRPGTWYRASGEARCHECGATFSLRVLDDEPAQNRT